MGSLFGHEVASELALERLNRVPGPRGRLEVRRAERDPLEADAELTAWSEIEDRTFAVARRPGGELLVSCSVTGAWSADPAEGLVQALPAPGVAATSIEIDTPKPGWQAEIQVAPDGAAPKDAPGEGNDWKEVGGGKVKRKRQRFALRTDGKRYRYYLVWITKLPPGAERVEISDVSLFRKTS